MNVSTTQKCYLSELLPYDPSTKKGKEMIKGIGEYAALLKIVKEAISFLKVRDFEQFDPLVGENACQIRAVKIAMIAQECLKTAPLLEERIASSEKEIQMFVLETLQREKTSLKVLLSQIDVPLTSNQFFLISSFLLSFVKEKQDSSLLCLKDIINCEKLGNLDKDLTNKFKHNLVKKARQLLSAASVSFMQEQAQLLKDEKLQKMSSKTFMTKYNGLECLPMFWTYKTLLLTAQKKEIPLVIYVKFLAKERENCFVNEECLFFETTKKESSYEASIVYPKDLIKTALFVQGVACANSDLLPSCRKWKETLQQEGISAILAGAADHRQYPDSKEDRKIEELNDQEFKTYKLMAKQKGYSLENPSMFFIQHVYPATVGSLPLLIQKMRLAEQVIGSFLTEKQLINWPKKAVIKILSYLESEGETK